MKRRRHPCSPPLSSWQRRAFLGLTDHPPGYWWTCPDCRAVWTTHPADVPRPLGSGGPTTAARWHRASWWTRIRRAWAPSAR